MDVECVAEFQVGETTYSVQKDDHGTYSVSDGSRVVQPDHDAEGIMRYLAHVIFNLNHKLLKADSDDVGIEP